MLLTYIKREKHIIRKHFVNFGIIIIDLIQYIYYNFKVLSSAFKYKSFNYIRKKNLALESKV